MGGGSLDGRGSVWRYVAPEKGWLCVGGASLVVSAFSNAFAPKAMGRVVDAFGKRRSDGGAGLRNQNMQLLEPRFISHHSR